MFALLAVATAMKLPYLNRPCVECNDQKEPRPSCPPCWDTWSPRPPSCGLHLCLAPHKESEEQNKLPRCPTWWRHGQARPYPCAEGPEHQKEPTIHCPPCWDTWSPRPPSCPHFLCTGSTPHPGPYIWTVSNEQPNACTGCGLESNDGWKAASETHVEENQDSRNWPPPGLITDPGPISEIFKKHLNACTGCGLESNDGWKAASLDA